MEDDPKPISPETSGLSAFWRELRRRKVVRIAVVYAVVAWLLIQVSATVFPQFGIPPWGTTFVTLLLAIGFPIALIMAWAFEVTPEGIKADSEITPTEGVAPAKGQKLNYITLGLVVLVLTFLIVDRYLFSPSVSQEFKNGDYDSSSHVIRSTIKLPEGQHQPRLMEQPLSISPDGTLIAYVAQEKNELYLFVRNLESFETRKVPGTEFAYEPFFSPDSEWIGFFSNGKLKLVPVEGGLPTTIADAPQGFGASWGPDDQIVYVPSINAGLWRISASGGTPERLSDPIADGKHYAHVWPQHLPGGKHVLFSGWGYPAGPYILNLADKTWQRAQNSPSSTLGHRYIPTGHLVYFASDREATGKVLAVPFDLKTFSVSGMPVPVLDDVRIMASKSAQHFLGISDQGTVIYVSHEMEAANLMWVDREGRANPIRKDKAVIANVRLSQDERKIVYDDEGGTLWIADTERGSVKLLHSKPKQNSIGPIWKPDGKTIVFSSNRGGGWDLYELDVGSRGDPRPLLVRKFNQQASSMTFDGKILAYNEQHPETGFDIWFLPEQEEPIPIATSEFNEVSPSISPDGSLLAFVSDETGNREVYVMTYPSKEVKIVSNRGGEEPVWSRDGKELFFRQNSVLLSVRVTLNSGLNISEPTAVFEMPFDRSFTNGGRGPPYYDVSNDGQRFLVVSDRPTTEFKLIQNWFDELNRLVPIPE